MIGVVNRSLQDGWLPVRDTKLLKAFYSALTKIQYTALFSFHLLLNAYQMKSVFIQGENTAIHS